MTTLNAPDIPPLTNRCINVCEERHQSEFSALLESVLWLIWVSKHKNPFELKLHEALEVVDVMAKNKNKIDESIRSLKELRVNVDAAIKTKTREMHEIDDEPQISVQR